MKLQLGSTFKFDVFFGFQLDISGHRISLPVHSLLIIQLNVKHFNLGHVKRVVPYHEEDVKSYTPIVSS